jgi:hypothetical protein
VDTLDTVGTRFDGGSGKPGKLRTLAATVPKGRKDLAATVPKGRKDLAATVPKGRKDLDGGFSPRTDGPLPSCGAPKGRQNRAAQCGPLVCRPFGASEKGGMARRPGAEAPV